MKKVLKLETGGDLCRCIKSYWLEIDFNVKITAVNCKTVRKRAKLSESEGGNEHGPDRYRTAKGDRHPRYTSIEHVNSLWS